MLSEIQIECLPGDLPEFIEVDMADLDLGEAIHLSDITTPEGVDIIALTHGKPNDQTVAAVHATREHDEDDLLAEGEEGAEDAGTDADSDSERGFGSHTQGWNSFRQSQQCSQWLYQEVLTCRGSCE